MAHQNRPTKAAAQIVPHFRQSRASLNNFLVYTVYLNVPWVKLVLWVNERSPLISHLTIFNVNDPDFANRSPVDICRFNINDIKSQVLSSTLSKRDASGPRTS